MFGYSKAEKKRSVKTVLSSLSILFAVIWLFTTTAMAGPQTRINVSIIDGTAESSVSTPYKEPMQILKAAGLTLGSNDKVDISGFSEEDGGRIVVTRYSTVHIKFDNNVTVHNVYAPTVGEALGEIGASVEQSDGVNYSFSDAVKDGMIIEVESAPSVKLTDKGKTVKYPKVGGTVEELLDFAGIELGVYDYTEPALDEKLEENDKVSVFRVLYKNETRVEDIDFETEEIEDDTLAEGSTEVVTEGVKGSKSVKYRVKYVNAEEAELEKLSETVISEPVKEVIKVGTKVVPGTKDTEPNGVESKNGFKLGQVIQGRKTYYCACKKCTGTGRGVTASGKRVHTGMANPYYIACNWLPLGSVIEVDGVNYLVADRGGSGLSRTGRIDIFEPGGHSACFKHSVGSVTIKIVRLGW